MGIRDVMELSKSTGIDLEFEFTNLLGQVVKCQVSDAWYGFFKVDGIDGFMRDSSWIQATGDAFDLRVTSKLS
jgi:hypothetical protein